MAQQIPIEPDAVVPAAAQDGRLAVVAPDIAYRRLGMVNVAFLGAPDAGDRAWVLVDAGLRGTAGAIARAAAARFGPEARPAAIVLTHGHFDHVGAAAALAERWDAPVWAHADERPQLDGTAPYPAPDPGAGGGAMAWLSALYPRGPWDLRPRLAALPAEGGVPGLPEWRWLATPGHAAGHVSLWRERDRALIAGDAFVATAQESVYAVARQAAEMHGPPRYFTPDWTAAKASVERLAGLAPDLAVTGHGPALRGPGLRASLNRLAAEFDRVARPRGRQPTSSSPEKK